MTEKPAANEVWLVATGEVYEGQETYTRHDSRPPFCDGERLYSAPPPDREQRAGFVMVPVEPTEGMTIAGVTRARLDEANLYRHEVAAIYAAMLAAAPPIEALEGGKTDLGASGPVHQDTSSTPASASELRNLVAALRKLGEPVYAIGGELPLGSDQLIALDAANAIERLSSKVGGPQA